MSDDTILPPPRARPSAVASDHSNRSFKALAYLLNPYSPIASLARLLGMKRATIESYMLARRMPPEAVLIAVEAIATERMQAIAALIEPNGQFTALKAQSAARPRRKPPQTRYPTY